jgi:SAM-dependent methyltransferase
MRAESLQEWFDSPLGEYVLARERVWLDETVPDIFGYHAVQLGFCDLELLRESRIANRILVSPHAHGAATVQAQFHGLPFEEQSIDLCVMPHVLEFAENPHEILREVDRIMRPEGRILILGFNPWSLFGARRLFASKHYPWQGQFVSLVRMKDWLQLLGFEASSGKLACYIPPCETEVWQRRWRFLEQTGDRWWGVSGGVYMLEAIKRVQGMRLIAPAWSDRKTKERKFATVANKGSIQMSSAADVEDVVKPAPHLRLIK